MVLESVRLRVGKNHRDFMVHQVWKEVFKGVNSFLKNEFLCPVLTSFKRKTIIREPGLMASLKMS